MYSPSYSEQNKEITCIQEFESNLGNIGKPRLINQINLSLKCIATEEQHSQNTAGGCGKEQPGANP